MLSGRRLDLLDPSPLDVEIEDIAHGLARVARWNGQTEGDHAFSVAEHSLLVEELLGRLKPRASAPERLAALLHDAPEFVIGDLITPFKAIIGAEYKDLERRLMQAIHLRFGLPPAAPAGAARLIKRADRAAAYLEAIQLAGFGEAEANRIFGRPRNLPAVRLRPKPPDQAKDAYLARFEAIAQSAAREA